MVTNAVGDPFEALGDPNRRDILRLLSEGDKPVGRLGQMTAPLRLAFDVACMYLPPLLEELGLAEVSHDARNNRMRAI